MFDAIFTMFAIAFSGPIKAFCGVPFLKYLAPFLMAFVNIPCLICLFLPLWITMTLAGPPLDNFNHDPVDTDPKSRNWAISGRYAFLIYYVITFIWILWLILSGCGASDKSDFDKMSTLVDYGSSKLK